MSGLHCKPGALAHRLFQAAAHSVSLDSVAVHSETLTSAEVVSLYSGGTALATVETSGYTDLATEWDTTYRYAVVAVTKYFPGDSEMDLPEKPLAATRSFRSRT